MWRQRLRAGGLERELEELHVDDQLELPVVDARGPLPRRGAALGGLDLRAVRRCRLRRLRDQVRRRHRESPRRPWLGLGLGLGLRLGLGVRVRVRVRVKDGVGVRRRVRVRGHAARPRTEHHVGLVCDAPRAPVLAPAMVASMTAWSSA